MTNIEESVIRSHSLKKEGIELTGIQTSKDIIVDINKLFVHKNDEIKNVYDEITINPKQLKDGLETKSADVGIKSQIDFEYANYSDILNGNIKCSEDDFTKQYYVVLDTKYDESIAFLNTTNVLVIDVDNVLINKPLVIEFDDEEKLIQTKNKIESSDNLKLYSNNDQLKLEINQHKNYKFSEVFNRNHLLLFFFIGSILSTFISIWAGLLFALTMISLSTEKFGKIIKGKMKCKKHNVEYGLNNKFIMSKIMDAVTDDYTVNISENDTHIIMTADEIDAEWKIKNEGVLPDLFVELFENIGFENLNTGSFELEIKPAHKIPKTDNCLVSECGIWCISSKQSFQKDVNIESEKILQYN